MIVYVSIGNSDDKLTQKEWSHFVAWVHEEVFFHAKIHGRWFSEAASQWQNACWCLEFESTEHAEKAREALIKIRTHFRQDSVAWAVAPETEFL